MFDTTTGYIGGDVQIMSTQNRGFTPEEIAERAMNKIMYIGQDAPPAIKEQAEAFHEHIKSVVLFYLKEAVKSDRTTVANRLRDAGHPELIKLLEN
jgi:hypothetical protein